MKQQIEQAKLQGQMAVEQAKLEIEREKMALQMQLEQQKLQVQAALQAEKQQQDVSLKREAMTEGNKLKKGVEIAKLRASRVDAKKLEAEDGEDPEISDDDLSKPIDEEVAEIKGGIQQLGQFMMELGQMMADLKAQADAPKRVIRDRAGNVVGVEAGGVVKQATRDEAGRIVGLN